MPLLEQVLEKNSDKIKIAFKHFPLNMHKAALIAATASLYADTQGKFHEFHNLLIQNSKSLNEEKILLLEKAGLTRLNISFNSLDEDLAQYLSNDPKYNVTKTISDVIIIALVGSPRLLIFENV